MFNNYYEQGDWRDSISDELQPGLAKIFIVEDPDNLMVESGIQKILASRDYDYYHYDNSIALRYFYETKFMIDSCESKRVNSKTLVISLNKNSSSARELPFDIYNNAKIVSLSLRDSFPDICSDVLNQLESEELDILYKALIEYTPGQLGNIASLDFVLRHVYQVAPEIVKTSSDLLRILLSLNYRDIALPQILRDRLISIFKKRKEFTDWPLIEILSNKKSFYDFLQNKWSDYVQTIVKEKNESRGQFTNELIHHNTILEDRTLLPFGHDDVRIYIKNCFTEGLLKPIAVSNPEILKDHWCLIGVKTNTDRDKKLKADELFELCHKTIPNQSDRHQMWYQFSKRWAELLNLYYFEPRFFDKIEIKTFQNLIDQRFLEWMLVNYSGLLNHPPSPPAMLHHVPKHMARELSQDSNKKVALIVIDGLALDQWITIRDELNLNVAIEESCVFAWVPTVTSVSRQALFSAKAPFHFSNSIFTTSSEYKLWKNFWLEQGLIETQIFYEKNLGLDNLDVLIDKLCDHRLRAIGLVINTVDDMMHGMKLGSIGMHNQIKIWAKRGYLNCLISKLNELGFSIYITADHGNVEAIGTGKVNEGSIAESRGERTRIYKTEALRADIFQKYNQSRDVVEWPLLGLPSIFCPIVSTGRNAFVSIGESIVGHGGVTIEEVIVPYIRISSS